MRLPESVWPILYAGIRVATAWISPVPGAVVFDPLPVLLARACSRADSSKWLGAAYLPGMLVGDWMAGMPLAVVVFRALVVVGLMALTRNSGFHRSAVTFTFLFSLATAVAVDAVGYYPLGFVTLGLLVQGFLWWGLLAPRSGGGSFRPVWPLLFPPLALVAIHWVLPSPPIWPFPHLGEASSIWVRILSALVLVEPFLWRVGKWLQLRRSPVDPVQTPQPMSEHAMES